MKVAFVHKREDAKRREESIGCHSHNYFGHIGVRCVGQQLSVAAAEQSHAQKCCGIQKSWDNNTLGMPGNHFSPARDQADVATSGRHCLPPQCSPQPSSSLAALLHLLTSTHCPCKSFFSSQEQHFGLPHLHHQAAQQNLHTQPPTLCLFKSKQVCSRRNIICKKQKVLKKNLCW